ncbi:MAG: biotin/lipoyl-binding protein, partial [Alistipes sp.]|nr:biotin/lipoyl-binding protein [Alistipes sp.]
MERIAKIFWAGTVLLLTACGGNTPQDQTKTEEIRRVTAVAAELKPVDQTATFTATVEAEVVNNIAPQSPVRIGKIYVEVGDRVRRGQRLVEMDSANLTQARVQMENAEIEFRRADELYKIGGESKSTWDARKLEYDVART